MTRLAGIAPVRNGRTFTFVLDRPRLLAIEVNGDRFRNLHLFANEIETAPPQPEDPDVRQKVPQLG
ncbi:hypothetical protein GE107_14120 [Cohnella sp. CFH 77786]|uniref:hypothetical protein n=1 Tax=Cohnella sp. CFH 77786 TaxID=2662265 RepID=UPI001C6110BB|nr:hypothetical protein [Cohnella sp. CFH 77786]MBW5447190.1 hypothetical protein [Cohnella sp. CFH 77786]